ncbi:MAG: hypothetical protein KIT72_04635 [Polyangiaceae bacterium]|nr:hypothetical protein [Polyangiaceae bacterium]MCW5789690.1 hypothetical protein [Polyangiaceae bacterium]
MRAARHLRSGRSRRAPAYLTSSGRVLACAVGLVLLGGCQASAGWAGPAPTGSEQPRKASAKMRGGARMIPLAEPGVASYHEPLPEGGARQVAYGMRVLRYPDGRVQAAERLFPDREQISAAELPARLGGGWLFFSTSSSTLWHAGDWLGEVTAVGELPSDVAQIIPGFDRVYVRTRQGDLLALTPGSWALTDLGSLPPAPGYSELAFLGEWVGAVATDLRGVMVTFDAGASWRSVPTARVQGVIQADSRQIEIHGNPRVYLTTEGVQEIDATGGDEGFAALGSSPIAVLAAQEAPPRSAPRPAPQPLGDTPLRLAALYGILDEPGVALVLAAGHLARVRLKDGALLGLTRDVHPGVAPCQGARVGRGVGFICGDAGGPSVVYQVSQGLTLTSVLRFDEPRAILASGTGGLVTRGECPEGAAVQATDDARGSQSPMVSHCVRSVSGKLTTIRVRGDYGVERVAALEDGRAAVVVPPRLGALGALVLISPDGRTSSRQLRFVKGTDAYLSTFGRRGLWLDGLVERAVKRDGKEHRVLSTWVNGGGPFVGVEIELDGSVRFGEMVSDDTDRSLISGPVALTLGQGGLMRESTDGGMTWFEAETPDGVGERSPLVPAIGSPGGYAARGCSAVGCAFGAWVRVGWQGEAPRDREARFITERPKPLLKSPSYSRWAFQCEPTGEVGGGSSRPLVLSSRRMASPPAAPIPHGYYGALPPVAQLPSTAFAPFLGVPPPTAPKTALRLDLGIEHPSTSARAYAWGSRSDEWARDGRWMVRVESQFDLAQPTWATAVSPADWPDPTSAALTFGQLARYGGYTNWRFTPATSDAAGLLNVTVRGGQTLYLLEEGKPPTRLRGDLWPLTNLAGLVRVGGAWYGGSLVQSEAFTVYRIEGGESRAVASFPIRRDRTHTNISLVRSAQADAFGVLVQVRAPRVEPSAGQWYLYPFDLEQRQVGEPLVISAEQLSNTPRLCGAEDDGWWIEGPLPGAPYLNLGAQRGSLMSARLIADAGGVCVAALAARSSDSLGVRPQAAGSTRGAHLTLTSRDGQTRWGYRCRP